MFRNYDELGRRTWWGNHGDTIIMAVVSMLVVFGGIGVLVLASYTYCSNVAEAMEVPHKWGLLSDCLVQINGNWIPLDQYIINAPVTP